MSPKAIPSGKCNLSKITVFSTYLEYVSEVASFTGHSQTLSRSHGENLFFFFPCIGYKIESGSGLRMKLCRRKLHKVM